MAILGAVGTDAVHAPGDGALGADRVESGVSLSHRSRGSWGPQRAGKAQLSLLQISQGWLSTDAKTSWL